MYLRRLERVFRSSSVCETMEDYKEEYLMVWTNYMSPCSSIVGLYFKGYHSNAQGPQKCPLNFSFCKLSEKLIQ